MSYSDKTDFPKIYANTHWGRFSLDNRSNAELKQLEGIVKNRNKFINDYEIKKICPKEPKKLIEYIDKIKKTNKTDHLECYVNKDGNYVLLNSPYVAEDEDMKDFDKIYQLYNGAQSFVKVITKEDLKKKDTPMKRFYDAHPELKTIDIKCSECGLTYKYFNKSKHYKTKLHNQIVKIKETLIQ